MLLEAQKKQQKRKWVREGGKMRAIENLHVMDSEELERKLSRPIIRVEMMKNGIAVKINQKGLN